MLLRVLNCVKQRGEVYWKPLYLAVNRRTGGALDVLAEATRSYARANAPEAAAAMTFYAVFSLFPLLAIVVTLSSLVIGEDRIANFLLTIFTPIFPASQVLITQNIERFITQRGAFTLLGGVSLIWAASGVFVILTHNINRAWENARVRNFLQRRLMALSLVGGILALMALSLVISTIFAVFTTVRPAFLERWLNWTSPIVPLLSDLLPFVVTYLIFLFVYRFVPAAPVRLSDTLWGALLVTVGWEVTSSAFTWYVGSGLAQYDILYGSIAALAILMLWLYINNILILLGAHLSAAVSKRRIRKNTPVVTAPVER